MSKTYTKTFSATTIGIHFTAIGTVYIIVNIFCTDRGSGEKYVVETLRIDIPQRLYLEYIAESTVAAKNILILIAEEIINYIPDSLRNSNSIDELTERIDLGPFLKWKFPQFNGPQWKCKQCTQLFPANSVRWIKSGSILSHNNYCFDCGKLKNRRTRGTYIITTHINSRVVMSEDEAEIYMSLNP